MFNSSLGRWVVGQVKKFRSSSVHITLSSQHYRLAFWNSLLNATEVSTISSEFGCCVLQVCEDLSGYMPAPCRTSEKVLCLQLLLVFQPHKCLVRGKSWRMVGREREREDLSLLPKRCSFVTDGRDVQVPCPILSKTCVSRNKYILSWGIRHLPRPPSELAHYSGLSFCSAFVHILHHRMHSAEGDQDPPLLCQQQQGAVCCMHSSECPPGTARKLLRVGWVGVESSLAGLIS